MTYVALAVVAVGAVYVLFPTIVGAYLRLRGKRVVQCPETRRPAGVEVDAGRAAIASAFGEPRLRLRDCTRWPERADCGQQCLAEIEAAPEECLVRTIVSRWYEDKRCVLCHKPIAPSNWALHKPALIDPNRTTHEWREIQVDELSEVFSTYQPICWNCHVAETFRREHGDLVVERPGRTATPPKSRNG